MGIVATEEIQLPLVVPPEADRKGEILWLPLYFYPIPLDYISLEVREEGALGNLVPSNKEYAKEVMQKRSGLICKQINH